MGKKILQAVLGVVILALIYVVYVQISTPIKFENETNLRKAAVIERIKTIRTAERQFKAKYQRFTADYDTLINFVLNETMTAERKIVDEDDSVMLATYKARFKNFKNSETFEYSIKDSIFKDLSEHQIRDMRFIPYTNNQREYILEAGIITTESKVVIPTVECRAPYIAFLDTIKYRQEIINLIDDQVNNFNNYAGIKFGSMESGNNEAGNWE